MFHRASGVARACFGIAVGLFLSGLAACSGGSGAAAPASSGSATVTQSSITLPSSVQVVSAK